MISFIGRAYRKLTHLANKGFGFYAAPLLHIAFTSVFAAAGFAYGFARAHMETIDPRLVNALLLGLAINIVLELYWNGGLFRLKLPTFNRKARFVNGMFDEDKLLPNRNLHEYRKLLGYLIDFGKLRAAYGPLHVIIVVGTVIAVDLLSVKSGQTLLFLQTAAVTLPIHVLFLYVTGDLHMGRYRSLVKRQLFFMGQVPPNEYSFSLKLKFASVLFVIALSDYILVSILRGPVAQSATGHIYVIGFSVFSLALLLVLSLLLFSSIFASIKELQLAAESLQEGRDPDFYSQTSDRELATLSSGFFSAAQRVLNYRRDLEQQIRDATQHLSEANADLEQKDREIQTELDFAAEIQRDMVPQQYAPWKAIQFGIVYQPMHKVSGDFLKIFKKKNEIYVLLADVSGHGVPAALITMAANDAFGAAIRRHDSPAAIFREVNTQLSDQIKTQDYLTAFLVRIDQNLDITYSNASHQKAIHFVKSKRMLDSYDTNGLFIGAVADATDTYEEKTSHLNLGDFLVLFTDGITEQVNSKGEEFGLVRLKNLILDNTHLPAQGLADTIYKALIAFADGEPLRDDVSLLVMSVHPHYRQFISLFNEAVNALKKRMLSESSKLLEELWKIYPEFPALSFLSARIYYRLGELELAEKHVRKHLEKNPKDLRGIQLLAMVCIDTGNTRRAQNLLNTLSKEDRAHRVTQYLLKKLP